MEISQPGQVAVDVLELNRLRRSLLIGSHVWDGRFYSLDSLLKRNSVYRVAQGDLLFAKPVDLINDSACEEDRLDYGHERNVPESLKLPDYPRDVSTEHSEPNVPPCEPCVPEDCKLNSCHHDKQEETLADGGITKDMTSFDSFPSHESTLSERIDSAWTGTDQLPVKAPPHTSYAVDGLQTGPIRRASHSDILPIRRLAAPVRVHSFDSALRVQERIQERIHVSSLRSFHASGDYRNMIRDPVSSVMRTYSQILPQEARKFNLVTSYTPSFISSASNVTEGVRMLLPQTGLSDVVVAVYDNEPTSIISYALSSKEYDDWVADKSNVHELSGSVNESNKDDSASTFSALQPSGSTDLDYTHYGSYGSEDAPSSMSSLFTDLKNSPHLRLSFGDDKVKFSVTYYFAELFDSLRKKCCPSEVDFVRSLSRCRQWSAQGGKSNVYFAKSLDERFIVKQVTKTELESFEEFAPEYFKYLTDSLSSGSPTCLAKVLGIYQVCP